MRRRSCCWPLTRIILRRSRCAGWGPRNDTAGWASPPPDQGPRASDLESGLRYRMAAVSPEASLSPSLKGDAPFFHRLGRRIEGYAELCRFNKPVGTWLLLWPALWALWVAGEGAPNQKVLIVFVLGVVVMRAAGCVINDFADRDIDPHVRRTRDRPLAARRVSPVEALVLFVVLLAVALILVTFLDRFTVELAFGGAALTVSYPFVK